MRSVLSVSLLVLLASGCLQSSTGPSGAEAARIRLHVTGGFAGVDFTLFLDGPGGMVIGESCVVGCGFEEGAVLHSLSRDQSAYLSDLFRDAGIHDLDGTDFGVECCDQFHYQVSFEDGDATSTIQGSSEAYPADLRDAVSQIHALLSGTLPIVVDHQTSPDRWPSDRVTVEEVALVGDRLDLRVHFSGGCPVHDFKLVAWGGWMESFPVQVRAFLSHDAKDDPCDAVVTRDLSFDLRPLKVAYEESYGAGDPGTTTVVISLANPDMVSSLSGWLLEYGF